MNRSLIAVSLACVLYAVSAAAQPPASPAPRSTSTAADADDTTTRPATTTFFGDSGVWFVPIAEVMPAGRGSATGYRRGTNYIQGYSNVGDFAGTFALGLAGRAELFGSFLADTRIERDTQPLFFPNPTAGGIVDRYPLARAGWSGNHLGDFYLGSKVNLLSESRAAPLALAVRGLVKLPTGDKLAGVSTGKMDVAFDLIASKDAARLVDLAGYGGYEYRGSPDGFQIPTGAFRWGGAAAFPSHRLLRVFGELDGVLPSSDTATITTAMATTLDASSGGLAPLTSNTENLTRLTTGVMVSTRRGFFVGLGGSWNMPKQGRDPARTASLATTDYWDWQVRIGFHPGVRASAAATVAEATPPPPPPPAPTPRPAPNQPPTVDAQCDPCTVPIGKTSTITATGHDPDGDALAYHWSAPTGTLADPARPLTIWTAPQEEGPVAVTVGVDDGRGGTASAMVRIDVVRPPVARYTFEDVHFDLDVYSLRPEALRVLDDAVAALANDPALRVTIDGHTCNIGTPEYNLALGNRRAAAVRDYLVNLGVPSNRVTLISKGKEQPFCMEEGESCWQQNRRGHFIITAK